MIKAPTDILNSSWIQVVGGRFNSETETAVGHFGSEVIYSGYTSCNRHSPTDKSARSGVTVI
jgi:hypothetical protein